MSVEENNWRLIKDTKKGKFCFLIGVNNWAIELQKHEFELLYKLLIKLNNQLLEINDELMEEEFINLEICLLYTSPSPRDGLLSRMPSSA